MGTAMRPTLRQYWDLTKPRVVALIVFTAAIGMFLAVPGLPPLKESVLGFLGIWLAASSAAAINQLLDSRIDAKMARTSWRPIVAGQVSPRQALVFALLLPAILILLGDVYALAAELARSPRRRASRARTVEHCQTGSARPVQETPGALAR